MKQSRLMSILETKVDVGVGFVGSWIITVYAMPLFGFHPNPLEATGVVAMYTVWALIRKYSIRRMFEWWRWREAPHGYPSGLDRTFYGEEAQQSFGRQSLAPAAEYREIIAEEATGEKIRGHFD